MSTQAHTPEELRGACETVLDITSYVFVKPRYQKEIIEEYEIVRPLIAQAWAIPQLIEALTVSRSGLRACVKNGLLINEPQELFSKIDAALRLVKEGKP